MARRIQRTGRGAEVALREMDVDGSILETSVAEEKLNGAQIGARFEQVCGEAVTKSMGMKRFANTGALGGFAAGLPDHLIANRIICIVPAATGKQPDGWFANEPAIMVAQFVEQTGAEHDVAVLAPLPFLDA